MNILYPGSFSAAIIFDYLSAIKIDNKDIMECYFIEDIYSMCTLGKITLMDKYGIKEYGPLTGDESIVIGYGNTSLIERVFKIYRIPKIEGVVDFKRTSDSVISIYFVDSYFNNLTMKKFSKGWDKNIKGSEIVSDIIKNMLQITDMSQVNIETSADVFKDPFYIPQWNAAETIRWLSNRLTGTTGKYGYLFYSSSDKFVNYVTLDGLLKSAKVDPDTYVFDSTDMEYENKIKSWQTSGVDFVAVKELGGGQLLGFDSSKKEFLGIKEDNEFIYSNVIRKLAAGGSFLGNSSLFDNGIDNNSKDFNYSYILEGESDIETLSNIFYNNFIRRYSLQNMVKVLVEGHDKRYAGMKIEVMWPTNNTKEIYNSMDSGQYLVKSVTNHFMPLKNPMYTQTLMLIKNAYNNNKYGNTVAAAGSSNIISSFLSRFV
jgi:hypothetical protein